MTKDLEEEYILNLQK